MKYTSVSMAAIVCTLCGLLLIVCWVRMHDYRPYGKLTPRQATTEVLIHKVDPHKVYTCENDPIVGDQTPGHYAVIDQIEALDAGYTPLGQGYCDIGR